MIHAARVLSEDSPAVPAGRLAVEQGRITVGDASRVMDEPAEVQPRALERVIRGGSRNLTGTARRVNDETSRQEDVAALESNRARPMAETITLHHAAVAGLDRLVAEASVDAIVTNPPTSHEALPLFSDLAAFAAHALRPGGVMAVLANAMRLPAIIGHLTHPGLEWAAEFDYRYGGPPVSSGYPHRVSLGRKPLLIYGKTGFRLQGGNDVIEVPPPDEPAMRPQVRQRDDAGMALIVERFARPGQVVCDPVLLDRSSTALAARRHGCIFIGAGTDRSCINRIRDRLARAESDGTTRNERQLPWGQGCDSTLDKAISPGRARTTTGAAPGWLWRLHGPAGTPRWVASGCCGAPAAALKSYTPRVPAADSSWFQVTPARSWLRSSSKLETGSGP